MEKESLWSNASLTIRQALGAPHQWVLHVKRSVGTRNKFCGHFKSDLGPLPLAPSGSAFKISHIYSQDGACFIKWPEEVYSKTNYLLFYPTMETLSVCT